MAACITVFGRTARAVVGRTLRLAGLVAPLALAACGATEGIGGKLLTGVLGDEPKPMDPALYAATPVCPEIGIREGTEFMPVFDPGKFGDPAAIRFQANVQRVARDCEAEGDRLRVRVGAAGRVLSGPKGAVGSVTVPVRVVVTLGDKVLYSGLTTANADVQAPDYSALWSIVDSNVLLSIADSHDATILVGLDGHPDSKVAKGKAKPAKKPVSKP
ncbi:hypothetical protein EYW49_16965 [Siculibacillus lacustris]|uniref:Lipoprotein n=1 Tax=Siculibacillus lacustris TaxID=1549641 RepID=A0A4Q9VIA7_9HYPH|nr:hypothetical protein [Siculibacillus lacustris]TBW34958.1 hypothetical protein EYW49_16965 [Siculibacillus lacustris]